MKDIFKGYYRPSDDEFKKMWEEGIFVFDTNVLLNFYRYKKETKDAILGVLDKIQDRIWIPYQVGLEFHRNRLTVITEQNKVLNDFKKSIKDSISDIEKKYVALQLDKRHTDIQAEPILEQFKNLSDTVLKELDEIKPKKLSNSSDEDEIFKKVSELFEDKVGKKPENQEWLNKVFKDGDERAKNDIPPSFKDITEAKKEDRENYSYQGLFYKAGYGDLILWRQIIEYAKQENKKYILFITDDKKEDWILSVSGQKISPRPELVMEICTEGEVKDFHIYNTESFLQNSKIMFDKPLSDKVIEDVVSVNKRNLRFKDFPLKGKTRSTRRPLIDWLESQYKALKPFPSNSYGFDFKGYDQNDVLTYIKYNSIYSEGFTDDALEEAMGGIRLHTKLAKAKKLLNEISYHLILIFPRNSSFIDSEVLRKEIITYFDNYLLSYFSDDDNSFRLKVTFGSLNFSDEFELFYSMKYAV